MTQLSHLIAKRSDTDKLAESDLTVLLADDIANLYPVFERGCRIALIIGDVGGLIKVLAAYDGHAGAILLLSTSFSANDIANLIQQCDVDRVVSDQSDIAGAVSVASSLRVNSAREIAPPLSTSWILTTSGTTGLPKMVCHELSSLTHTIAKHDRHVANPPIWGLTYEATRFGGLQVLLQSLITGSTLVAPALKLPIADRIEFFLHSGVTHLSGTPTFWRRILMHPKSRDLALRQITLGGEIVDQDILNTLSTRFPDARVTHIYASTEAGVGFSVQDGREGFPAAWSVDPPANIQMRIEDDRLWLRPSGPSPFYLGDLKMRQDVDEYIDTLDRVVLQDDRILFLGRDNGSINIAGSKVFPETVERSINAHADVSLCHVWAKKNAFSGSILIADVVPARPTHDATELKHAILRHCRATLPAEAVPALVNIVPEIATNAAGKLKRS